ncbi:MAG: hypothetical protein E4G91_06665 [Candidatus Zixiibacteriota bacterium]|nr:MAG: hypothetical protein E4G91_06665 [candidate division Zixibacteria bacterium]
MKKLITVRRLLHCGGFLVIVAGILLAGCSIKSPQAPSWDTTLRLPLINKTFSSGELFDKLAADNIRKDSAGNSSFYIEKNLDSVSVRSVLAVATLSSEFEKQVGLIAVVSPSAMSLQIAFADIVPLAAGVVPDTGLWVAKTLGPTNSFAEATIAEGGLIVTATNNTGFALDSLIGQLRDPGTDILIATFVVPHGLADGASYVDTVSLAGKTIRNESDFDIFFHTQGGLALSLADRSVDFAFNFTNNLKASSVTGRVGEFTNEYDNQAALTDDIHLQTAAFSSGTLEFTVENQAAVDAQLTITFPEITNGGAALTLTMPVSANGSTHQTHDLSGWTVQPQHDSLQAQMVATILSSGDNYVTVNSTDHFGFRYSLGNLELASATGIIPPTDLNWNDQQVSVEIPRGFEGVSLALVELQITLQNYSELSGDVEINLQASNGKHLTVTGSVSGGSSSTPSVSRIVSDQLADLLTPLPNAITINGIATVGDGITTVQVTSRDYLSGSAVISAPMALNSTIPAWKATRRILMSKQTSPTAQIACNKAFSNRQSLIIFLQGRR